MLFLPIYIYGFQIQIQIKFVNDIQAIVKIYVDLSFFVS